MTDDTTACSEHSYGEVNKYLRRDPCVAAYREMYILEDSKGKEVLLAVARVEMNDTDSAKCLHELLDEPESGNLTELSRERGPYKSIRYNGAAYASRRNGAIVINAQAKSTDAGAANLDLKSIVDDVVR